MQKTAIAAAIFAFAASAQALTLSNDQFSVNYLNADFAHVELNGNMVLWRPGDSANSYDGTPSFDAFSGQFAFAAQAGYKISGYQIDYEIYFFTNGHAEDVGSISASTGGSATFRGSDSPNAFAVSDQVTGAAFPVSLDGTLFAQGRSPFCTALCDTPDAVYEAGWSYVGLQTVYITPSVVAIPEPQTYALMLAGLGLVGAAARRNAKRPG